MADVRPQMGPPTSSASTTLAFAAYEALAAVYDRFTADYEYDRWLDAIEEWAFAHGLDGRSLLDVACGTGKSFLPMLAKGYQVTACDLSPSMVAAAREKAPQLDIRVADMRSLPWAAQFDLITCMDDAVNYLLSDADLAAALRSMATALAPGGILVFDTNSLMTYRSTFAQEFVVDCAPWQVHWHGESGSDFRSGDMASATVEMVGPGANPVSRHVQRHWPVDVLRGTCEQAGFERVSFRGQMPGGLLTGDPDEMLHIKVVCLAARARPRGRRTRRNELLGGWRAKEETWL
jgi:SAM-dependent methyltransferase